MTDRQLAEVIKLVLEQVNDKRLWFRAETLGEANVQAALIRLHAAIEGKPPMECVMASLAAYD